MFDFERLTKSDYPAIQLATCRGNSIKNDIAPEPGYREKENYRIFRNAAGVTNLENRKPACGRYNCFGHIFASRRTAIREDVEVDKIFRDDSYRLLSSGEDPKADDIALYYDKTRECYLHVARITSVVRLGDSLSISVLSKWNDVYGEDVHPLNFVDHWTKSGFAVGIKLYTERPLP